MSDEELLELEQHACPGAGACGGQFTANTMACVGEAIGLSLPNSNMAPAPYRSRDEIAVAAGKPLASVAALPGAAPATDQAADAVYYQPVTYLEGVMEKYKPGDYEFDLPARLMELAKKKDYGQYIDKQRNDLVVSFITTNDITGGNSGSPVINGNGELIGLAFDGNYEALSHKIAFDKDLNRTICVDVRYVLWCIDKLGGASHLIKELKLVK
jgi:hypothetical protein